MNANVCSCLEGSGNAIGYDNWNWSLFLASGCQEQPTREELLARVATLEAQNNDLTQKLEAANQSAQKAHDAAQEAADAAGNGEVDEAQEAAQRSADAAGEAADASE